MTPPDVAGRRCGRAMSRWPARSARYSPRVSRYSGPAFHGGALIPVFQFPKTGTNALRPALDAGTLNVTFSGSLLATIQDVTPSIVDTVSIVHLQGRARVERCRQAGRGGARRHHRIRQDGFRQRRSRRVGNVDGQPHDRGDRRPGQEVASGLEPGTDQGGHHEHCGSRPVHRCRPDRRPVRSGPGGCGPDRRTGGRQTTLLAYASGTAGGGQRVLRCRGGAHRTQHDAPGPSRSGSRTPATPPAELSVSYEGVVAQPGVSYKVRPSTRPGQGAGRPRSG